jgi:hypothetical protein
LPKARAAPAVTAFARIHAAQSKPAPSGVRENMSSDAPQAGNPGWSKGSRGKLLLQLWDIRCFYEDGVWLLYGPKKIFYASHALNCGAVFEKLLNPSLLS